jgi:hypothetical protein
VTIDRDAVFIECDGLGARVLPEGKRLSLQAQPAEQELLRERLRKQGAAFFLVRPNGFNSFELYRRVVLGLRGGTGLGRFPIGYEPIPSNATVKLESENGKMRLIITYKS